MERKAIILLGHIGCGKTSLFNKICNSKEKVRSGGESVTKQIFMSTSAYGQGFNILDTPGFGSDKERLLHAAAIKTALSEQSLIKFERTATMKKNFREVLQIVQRFKHLVTIIVTHWDKSENPQNDENDLRNEFLKIYNIDSFIFSGEQTTGERLCQQIDCMLAKQKFQKVELTYTEFTSFFQLFDEDLCQDEMYNTLDKLKVEFSKSIRLVIEFIKKQNDQSLEIADLMHAIILAIKNYAIEIIERFETSHGQQCNQLYASGEDIEQAYLVHTKLKDAIMGDMKNAINEAQSKMKQYPYHIYNHVKQCPNCGEVFIKVSGCGGSTTCGNRPSDDDPNFRPTYSNYKIVIKPSGVEVQKLIVQVQQAQQKQNINQNQKQAGCGATFQWNKLPPLSVNKIQELKDIGYLDYLNRDQIDKTLYVKESEYFKSQVEKAESQARANVVNNIKK